MLPAVPKGSHETSAAAAAAAQKGGLVTLAGRRQLQDLAGKVTRSQLVRPSAPGEPAGEV